MEKEYTFCSVKFNEYGKSYYYLTDDSSLEIGDYVTVTVKAESKVVKIVNVEKFKESEVPLDINKTKYIESLHKKKPNQEELMKEYTFCSVKFNDYSKSYYYLTDDLSLEIGDFVYVDVRSEPNVVKIIDINKFSYNEAPIDPTTAKHITGLFKKNDAPISNEKSIFGSYVDIENDNEDITVEGLFDYLDEFECEVQDELTEEQILHFEELNEISLPIQYREMLLKEGNGLRIHYKTPNDSVFKGDIHLRTIQGIKWNKKYGNKRLARPFIFTEAYDSDDTKLPYPQFKDCERDEEWLPEGACYACDHKFECIYVDPDLFWDNTHTPFYNGTLELVYAGCTYSYHLILNGPFRGEVWVSDENTRFHPYAKSFREFLEKKCTVIAI